MYKKVLGLFVLVAVLAIFVAPAALASDAFPDVPDGHWAHDFITWVFDNGISSGYPDGTYRPDNNVTRAELAVFAKRGFELAEASPGRLKAVVFALCNPTPSQPSVMYRAENNVNGVPITISDGVSATDGRCVIDFGFPVTDRFVVATARHPTTPLGVTAVYVGDAGGQLPDDQIEFFVWHGANGLATGGPIMVLVY